MAMMVPALFAVPGTMTPTSLYRARRSFTMSSAVSPEPPGVSRIKSIAVPFRFESWSLIGNRS